MSIRLADRLSPRLRRFLVVSGVLLLTVVVLPARSSSEDLPGADDLPQTRISNSHAAVVTVSQVTAVRRSKMFISIGPDSPIWGALYQPQYNYPVGDPNPTEYRASCATRGTPPLPPCVAWPFAQPDCATADTSTQYRVIYFRGFIYPFSPLDGGGADVGKVAEVRVNLAAFGSIPASATITLRTPRVNGKVKPFVFHDWQSVARPSGCDPTFHQSIPNGTVRVLVEGSVNISISDLKVDGVPVELGDHCRTVRPADLQLWSTADGSYFPAQGGTLGAWDGLQDTTDLPWDSPYYTPEENGRVLKPSTGLTVPPFTGCGTNGEDLSPLLTAMASGPNNPISVSQGTQVQHQHTPGDGKLDLDDLKSCRNGFCPTPGPDSPERPPLPAGD